MRMLVGTLFCLACVGASLLTGCDGLTEVPGAGTTSVPVLSAPKLHEKMRIRVDGKLTDLPWNQIGELTVPLAGGGGGVSEVRLKAAHDGTYLYLLAVWPDKTRSFNRYWKYVGLAKWEKHVGEDAFSICWSPGSLQDEFREQGCALFCHNGKHVYDMNGKTPRSTDFADFWYWGAQQTGAKFTLRDMRLPFGRHDRLRGDRQGRNSDNMPNQSKEYEGPWGVPRMVGPKRSPYILDLSNAQPLPLKRLREKLNVKKNLGWIVALDVQRKITGSRADVAARAKKYDDVWVLEMRRRLNTKNPDDQILNPEAGVSVFFSVAIHDGTEKEAHIISAPIELRFTTKTWK